MDDVREAVRERYAAAARSVQEVTGSACCGPDCCSGPDSVFGGSLYNESTKGTAPDEAFLASLGCGNPTAVAELREGEVVLDLGAGGGLDVILSAKRVGPTGKAYGLDMTEEMLALALQNKERAGIENVEFLKGYIEAVPLPANTVDVLISNCVVNLSPDKATVFVEAFRVLKPGGRLAITDVVADLSSQDRSFDPDRWSACLAGALTRDAYQAGLLSAGFEDVEIVDTHSVGEGYASAIIRGRKPTSHRDESTYTRRSLPVTQQGCC
jgi:ubiquinone/menaquinone biosynthesis C-methylase UbiE